MSASSETGAPVIRKRLHIFHRRSDADQRWYWHITLGNGEIVAQGEGYANQGDMLHMLGELFDLHETEIDSLKKHGIFAWAQAAA